MLEVSGLSVAYGRHQALDGVALAVGRGEICVILGANGAGKTTLLKAVAGLVPAAPGYRAVMAGMDIAGLEADLIVEQGIALVPEGRGIFADLTVAENLELGAYPHRARMRAARGRDLVHELFPKLRERRRQIVRTMSGGERQMVAIGRALMSAPEILMLDEPSLGLSPLLSKELFRSLRAIRETGAGILLVEQNARLSLAIADRGYLLENGRMTGEDTAARLLTDPAVVRAYLGGAPVAAPRPAPGEATVSASSTGTTSGGDPSAGALARRAGEILAAKIAADRMSRPVPSAFAALGYRPEMPSTAAAVSSDALALGARAGAFAARATEVLKRHLAARRAPAAVAMPAGGTGAKPCGIPAPPKPRDRHELTRMAASLAAAAEAKSRRAPNGRGAALNGAGGPAGPARKPKTPK